jgi:hypothetical protein
MQSLKSKNSKLQRSVDTEAIAADFELCAMGSLVFAGFGELVYTGGGVPLNMSSSREK